MAARPYLLDNTATIGYAVLHREQPIVAVGSHSPKRRWARPPPEMAVRTRKQKGLTMTYPGGKGNCYQHIINQMPPHDVYIETHLGGGSVMLKKRPARLNIGVELDPAVLKETAQLIAPGSTAAPGCAAPQPHMAGSADTATNGDASGKYLFVNGDAVDFLRSYQFSGREYVYLDPPYLIKTRSSQRPIYQHEYTEADHVRLLETIRGVDCYVGISGYWSELYADMLAGWRTVTFTAVTRGNTIATEWLFMNYPEPDALHDYSFLGDSYNERWNLTKRKRRWIKRLKAMPPLERKMLLWAMREAGFDLSGQHSRL